MSFAVVIELATLIAYAVTILGGVQCRSKGWKVVCALLAFAGIAQCVSMAIVVSLTHCTLSKSISISRAFKVDFQSIGEGRR